MVDWWLQEVIYDLKFTGDDSNQSHNAVMATSVAAQLEKLVAGLRSSLASKLIDVGMICFHGSAGWWLGHPSEKY